MGKLKLVVSDLHLGSGHLKADGSLNTFEEFYYDEKFDEFLHYYSIGEFQETEVELILNGDIFNLLQVDFNGHHTTVITESIDLVKLKSIIAGHPRFFASLKRFAVDPRHTITYVVGNHDQGMLWKETRQLLDEVCGTRINFKNMAYFFDGIHIEHGHQHEASNRIDPKKFFLKKDLPEPILNLPWASYFFVDFVLQIKKEKPFVDKVRPFPILLRWGLINDFWFTLRTILRFAWHFLVKGIGDRRHHTFSLVNSLKIMRDSAVFPDLEQAAHAILDDERVHTVIFGHTHVYRYRQWSHNKEYLNTGTWTELTSLDIANLGKLTKLTYALVEYPTAGGRPRARLKEWKGQHKPELDVALS